MAEHRAEVAAITARPGPPTFDDTVVALERSGATLRRVSAVFFVLVGSLSTPGIRETEARVAPLLAAHADAITLDPALFARLDALHAVRHELGLDPESLRLLERRTATRSGPGAPRPRRSGAAARAERRAVGVVHGVRHPPARRHQRRGPGRRRPRTARRALSGRSRPPRGRRGPRSSRPLRAPARAAHPPARSRLPHRPGVAGTAVPGVGLTRRAGQRARHTRRRPADHRAACRAGGPLGHPHHASWVIEVGTAETVEAVEKMLAALVRARGSQRRGRGRRAGRPRRAPDRALGPRPLHGGGPPGAGHRHRGAAPVPRAGAGAAPRRVRRGRRALRAAVHRAARPVRVSPGRTVFHVERDSEPVGLFVADHFARETKRGGAWMNSFVVQSRLLARGRSCSTP